MGAQAEVGLRRCVPEYLREPGAWVYPPPLRWMWSGLGGWLGWVAWAVAVLVAWWNAGWVAGVLVGSAPLGGLGRGRVLADGAVGAVWLGAVLSGEPWVCGLAAVVMLGLKEGSLAMLPSLVVASGSRWVEGIEWVVVGTCAWGVVTTLVCGRRWVEVLWVSVREQGHAYTREHQGGGVWRVWVDLAVLSGWVVAWLVWGRVGGPVVWASLTVMAVHAVGPVQNARVWTGADWGLRCALALAVQSVPWASAMLAIGVVADVWVGWRIRAVRDPVSSELGKVVGRVVAGLTLRPDGSYEHAGDPGERTTGSPRRSVTEAECRILAWLAYGRRVLEIGTGLGVSARAMASMARCVVTMDPDPWVHEAVVPALQDSGLPIECLRRLDGPGAWQFDMAFIDGSHVYEDVKADLAAVWPLIHEGGLIVLHDARHEPVARAAAEFGPMTLIETEHALGLVWR